MGGSVGLLAMDKAEACGIAALFLDPENGSRAHIVAVWTAPSHRRRGIARLLLNELLGWANRGGAHTVYLMVAIAVYEELGFKSTRRTIPYPNDPALVENEMSKGLNTDY
jgi:GNAT superfamily N-acetyltransferase